MTSLVVTVALALALAGCSGTDEDAEPGGGPTTTGSGAAATGPELEVTSLDPGAGAETVEVAGVVLDVPEGLEARPSGDGTTEKVALHAEGRERAVLVLGVTVEDAGVTDGDVDVARTVTAHQLEAGGFAQDLQARPVRWDAFGYASAVTLDLLVEGTTYDVLWLAGRDPDGTRLVTVHVEVDEGEDLEGSAAFEALRSLRFS